jgi:hypothetical protein
MKTFIPKEHAFHSWERVDSWVDTGGSRWVEEVCKNSEHKKECGQLRRRRTR